MTGKEHAETLVEFHKIITDGGISPDAAGALVIEFSRAILAGKVEDPEPDKAEVRDAIAEAAAAKRAAREERLAG